MHKAISLRASIVLGLHRYFQFLQPKRFPEKLSRSPPKLSESLTPASWKKSGPHLGLPNRLARPGLSSLVGSQGAASTEPVSVPLALSSRRINKIKKHALFFLLPSVPPPLAQDREFPIISASFFNSPHSPQILVGPPLGQLVSPGFR